MNYKRIIAGLSIVGIFAVVSGFTRIIDDPVKKIAEQLDKWISSHPQEKVYLQLDKPYYASGEDIWFKAYVTVGSSHELSGLSGILNVDLIDDKDSVKQSVKLPVLNGLTWGDFALPDTFKEGNYRIRAYTNWMRNAGEDYFFDKTITIVNSISNDVFIKANYTYDNQNGQQKVNSTINYTDLTGAPYAGKTVSYTVQIGPKPIKGKGVTDDKGNLNINFISPGTASTWQGKIIAELKISNGKSVTKSVLIKAASSKVDVQFFPEGGSLVNGNETTIAFKAVGADGLGTSIKGVVTDNQNNQVTGFTSSHLGMGAFNLISENDKTYKAKITYADGSENTVDLPAAVNTGYSLKINSESRNVIVQITPGSAIMTSSAPTEAISLIAQSGGVICYAGKSKPDSKSFTAIIPKTKFPTGIVQFTLFSSTGEPMNERLVFIQNHDQLKLGVAAEHESYSPRQKVTIDLNANDKDDKPVVGSFSVAVTDETKVTVDESAENNILSDLLLTSDLKGYIEKPGYYFADVNQKTMADLDVLMLTQGYHRFEWKQLLNDNLPPIIFQPEKTLEISGHLKTLGGKPIAHGKITLFSTKGGVFLIDTVSDDDGKFTFRNLVFKDSIKFVIQARTAKDRKNVQIDVDNVMQQKVGPNKNAPDLQVNISDGLSAYLENSKLNYTDELKYGIGNHAIQLKTVEIKAIKEPPVKDSENLNGPGNADQVIKADVLGTLGCGRLTDCLQGLLFGVVFRSDTPYSTRSMNTPMQIMVDGVYVDAEVLNNLNAPDIEGIEVLRSIMYTSIYGGRGGGGILIITTKRGDSAYAIQRYAPGIITYNPKGYHKARVFYSPKYDDPKTNTQIKDLRSTIYWNPSIITGKDGKASFNFFNADAKGSYRVIVEGIGANGELGRQVYHYKVE